jgi:phosphoribosyl-dephospho-CoA transferase
VTPERPGRHDFVFLRDACDGSPLRPLPAGDRAALDAWLAHRRPLVVARPLDGDDAGALRLGLALPGRRRVDVLVARDAIVGWRDPPRLEAALAAAPTAWRLELRDLARRLDAIGVPARVYGSLAWQHLAADPGLVYVTETSDVDLLVRPSSWRAADAALRVLAAAAEASVSPRVDGEVVLLDGSAVAWRELAMRREQVLVKTPTAARLVRHAEVRAMLDGSRA